MLRCGTSAHLGSVPSSASAAAGRWATVAHYFTRDRPSKPPQSSSQVSSRPSTGFRFQKAAPYRPPVESFSRTDAPAEADADPWLRVAAGVKKGAPPVDVHRNANEGAPIAGGHPHNLRVKSSVQPSAGSMDARESASQSGASPAREPLTMSGGARLLLRLRSQYDQLEEQRLAQIDAMQRRIHQAERRLAGGSEGARRARQGEDGADASDALDGADTRHDRVTQAAVRRMRHQLRRLEIASPAQVDLLARRVLPLLGRKRLAKAVTAAVAPRQMPVPGAATALAANADRVPLFRESSSTSSSSKAISAASSGEVFQLSIYMQLLTHMTYFYDARRRILDAARRDGAAGRSKRGSGEGKKGEAKKKRSAMPTTVRGLSNIVWLMEHTPFVARPLALALRRAAVTALDCTRRNEASGMASMHEAAAVGNGATDSGRVGGEGGEATRAEGRAAAASVGALFHLFRLGLLLPDDVATMVLVRRISAHASALPFAQFVTFSLWLAEHGAACLDAAAAAGRVARDHPDGVSPRALHLATELPRTIGAAIGSIAIGLATRDTTALQADASARLVAASLKLEALSRLARALDTPTAGSTSPENVVALASQAAVDRRIAADQIVAVAAATLLPAVVRFSAVNDDPAVAVQALGRIPGAHLAALLQFVCDDSRMQAALAVSDARKKSGATQGFAASHGLTPSVVLLARAVLARAIVPALPQIEPGAVASLLRCVTRASLQPSQLRETPGQRAHTARMRQRGHRELELNASLSALLDAALVHVAAFASTVDSAGASSAADLLPAPIAAAVCVTALAVTAELDAMSYFGQSRSGESQARAAVPAPRGLRSVAISWERGQTHLRATTADGAAVRRAGQVHVTAVVQALTRALLATPQPAAARRLGTHGALVDHVEAPSLRLLRGALHGLGALTPTLAAALDAREATAPAQPRPGPGAAPRTAAAIGDAAGSGGEVATEAPRRRAPHEAVEWLRQRQLNNVRTSKQS